MHTELTVVLCLLESVAVAMIPGSAYGVEPCLRMSIAAGLGVIEEGCRRIASAASTLQG